MSNNTSKSTDLRLLPLDEAQHESCHKMIRHELEKCGWTDQLKTICRETIRDKGSEMTVTRLLEEVSRKAKEMLPESVKQLLIKKMLIEIDKQINKTVSIANSIASENQLKKL